jgi:predicted MFS family arabinose efflux permease
MVCGLLMIALVDVASIATTRYDVFLGLRALGGAGWAMFATVATTSMVSLPAAQRRGRAVSLLLMSETSGLLLGTAAVAGSTREWESRARFCSRRHAWSRRRPPSPGGRHFL